MLARARSVGTIGGLLGRQLARLGYDRATRGVGIPATVGALDAAYVASVVGRRVDAIEVLEGTEGTTDRVRLSLRGDDRLPDTVFVKMASAGALIRLFGNIADLGGDEVRFYRDIRPTLDLEAPVVLGLDHDLRTKRFVLVLEDLQARGCTFGDVLHAFDLDRARAALDTLAVLHASQWASPRLARPSDASGGPTSGLAWVRANSADRMLPLFAVVANRLADRLARDDASLVPPDGRVIVARYPEVAASIDRGEHTILHGDPHPGNWYVDGERAGLLDWQAVRRGNPLRDVAYLLVLGLDPEVRRAHERTLLAGYADRLATLGGPTLGPVEAWDTYRSMVAYPYVAALFTAGFGGLQGDAIAREGLRRAALAIVDLDSRRALGL